MNVMRPPSESLLFGSRHYTDVSRALGELQARRPIRIDTTGEALLALPIEALDDQRLIEFEELCRPAELNLIVTQQRDPSKLVGLTGAGIEIAARIPLEAPVTPDNKRYLTTKAVRSGHRLSI